MFIAALGGAAIGWNVGGPGTQQARRHSDVRHLELPHFIMERAMLMGIKKRAEGLPQRKNNMKGNGAMEQDVVTTVVEASEQMAKAQTARGLVRAARQFVAALALVPDCPISDFASSALDTLQPAAERVVATIEARLDAGRDRDSVQLELAKAIYDIRRELEEINRWRQHYSSV